MLDVNLREAPELDIEPRITSIELDIDAASDAAVRGVSLLLSASTP